MGGRNRTMEPRGPAGQFFGHKLAHAEMNALLGLDFSSVDPALCVMYATTEPCDHCAGAILVARVGELRFAKRDAFGGRADLLTAHPDLRPTPLRVVGPRREDLEVLIMALQTEYWLRSGHRDAPRILGAWEQIQPRGVRLGERLHESTAFRRLREHAAPAAEATRTIASLLPG